MEDKPKIMVEETNLEDLILLGDDKLIDCSIEYPNEYGVKVRARTKIKQLTMKELKNINVNKRSFENSVKILSKTVYKQDGTLLGKDLIMELPVGVVNELSDLIMELSGVDVDKLKKH